MFGSQVQLPWPFVPSVLLGVALMTGGYLLAVTRGRGRFPGSRPVATGRIIRFILAMLTILLALQSPLDRLSDDYLFSAHMFQHILLTLVLPPLLLAGLPGWLLRPLFVQLPALLRVGRALTHPLVAFPLFNVIFIGYHSPPIYGAVAESLPLHVLAHLIFMVAGVLTWWPVMSPLPELPPLQPPLRLLYLFLQTLPSQVLGALLTFSGTALYARYVDAPRVWDWLTPMADQELGGLLMWVGGGSFFLGAFAVVFLHWAQFDDRRARQRQVAGRA